MIEDFEMNDMWPECRTSALLQSVQIIILHLSFKALSIFLIAKHLVDSCFKSHGQVLYSNLQQTQSALYLPFANGSFNLFLLFLLFCGPFLHSLLASCSPPNEITGDMFLPTVMKQEV